MKQIRYVMLLGLMISGGAQADVMSAPVVEKVVQKDRIFAACPNCPGGPLKTVTEITVSFESCRAFDEDDFTIETRDIPVGISGNMSSIVTVKLHDAVADCAGPTRRHVYALETLLLKKRKHYVLTNPSALVR